MCHSAGWAATAGNARTRVRGDLADLRDLPLLQELRIDRSQVEVNVSGRASVVDCLHIGSSMSLRGFCREWPEG